AGSSPAPFPAHGATTARRSTPLWTSVRGSGRRAATTNLPIGSPSAAMHARLKGIHRVERKLADGRSRFHYYAWRGGPTFWTSDTPVPEDAPADFVAAFEKARAGRLAPAESEHDPIDALIRRFRAANFDKLSSGSRATYD